jgi:hypothetical protein
MGKAIEAELKSTKLRFRTASSGDRRTFKLDRR